MTINDYEGSPCERCESPTCGFVDGSECESCKKFHDLKQKVTELETELKITRKFILAHDLQWELLSFSLNK